MSSKPEYVSDPEDGMRAMRVGDWGKAKYDILRKYVQAASTARKKWPEHCFVDLYCGPGRINYKTGGGFADGGAIVAWRQSVASREPFTKVYISDLDPLNVECCSKRLRQLGATVVEQVGKAVEIAPKVADMLPHGQHVAYLDPFSLGAMPFSVVQAFANLKKTDIILNYAISDQTRNLDKMMAKDIGDLDAFAPGWEQVIDPNMPIRGAWVQLVNYWLKLLMAEGVQYSEVMPEFKNTRGGVLYWLVYAAHHGHGFKLWESIANDGQRGLFGE